jgi:hypothetical protein
MYRIVVLSAPPPKKKDTVIPTFCAIPPLESLLQFDKVKALSAHILKLRQLSGV